MKKLVQNARSLNEGRIFATILLCFTFTTLSAQWEATSFPENEFPYNIVTSPNGNLMVTTYPGTGGYIYLSQDKGDTWVPANVEGAVYSSTLTVGNTMFFGGRGSKIARTDDDGLSWQLFDFADIYNTPDADIYALAYHNGKLYAAVFGSGICYSEDMGETWQETDRESLMVSYSIDGRNTYTMESFKGNLYAIGANGIWTLNEDDMTWSLQRETWYSGQSLILNEKMYIGYVIQNGETGIEYTEDGENWVELPKTNDSLPSNDIRGFQTDGTNIFVGTFSNGVYYSTDNGNNWVETEDWAISFEVPGIMIILSIPMDFCFLDDMVFAASFEKGVFKMTNPNPQSVSELIEKDFRCAIFPNPADQTAVISFEAENASAAALRVYDILKHEVLSCRFDDVIAGKNQQKIDVSNLKTGTYIYILRIGEKEIPGKFVVR